MLITKISPFSGKTNTLFIPITEVEYSNYLQGNAPIQRVFPHLTPDEREFILTGITPDEWPV